LGRPAGEEGIHVADIDGGPVGLLLVRNEKPGEITDDADAAFDGGISAGLGPGAACPVSLSQQVIGEGGYCRAQRRWSAINAPLAPSGGQLGLLVGGHRHAPGDEEVLQRAGQGSHRATRATGAFQQCLWVGGAAVTQ